MSVVVDGGDEAEIVAAHIEDGDGPPALNLYLVGVRKHTAGFDEILPSPCEHQTSPIVQWPACLGEADGIMAQGASFD